MFNPNDENSTNHKKWGKNHKKSSPNTHGCPKNGNKAHKFENYEVYGRIGKSFTSFITQFCSHCGKKPSKKKKLDTPPVAKLTRIKGEYSTIDIGDYGDYKCIVGTPEPTGW